MSAIDGYDKADIVALIGMVVASTDYAGYLPASYELMGPGGMGLAALAIFGKLYVKHKSLLVTKIDTVRHRVFKSEHTDGDEEIIEDIVDVVADVIGDVAEDKLDDGELNSSND